MFSIIILTIIISSCLSLPTEEKETGKLRDCVHGILNPTCLKIGAITLIEKLNKKDEVSLFPGVSLVKEGDSNKFDIVAADVARSLTGKGDERLDKYLLYHVGNFLDTHSLKFKLLDNGAVEEAVEEGRKTGMGGGGKKGGMGGIIAMAMMMKGEYLIT